MRIPCIMRARARAHPVVTPEYRSAIFYHTPEQLEIAKRVTEEVQKKHFDPIGTCRERLCVKT